MNRHIIVCPTNRPQQCVPTSCKDLLSNPSLPSGEYTIVVDGNAVTVYCEMGTPGVCGGEGGWTRIASVNVAAGDVCPSGLFPQTRDDINICERDPSVPGCQCDGTTFDTHGISYTKVCGRVRGYQYNGFGVVDGLFPNRGGVDDLNSCYVDGVSITRGSPREHVWTLANGGSEDVAASCPCSIGSTETVPSYVGDNYYCESGSSLANNARYTFHSGDPLWDGQDCNDNEASCCTNPNLPYFVRDLSVLSTDDVELRVCTSEGPSDEAVGIDQIELYIK